MCVCIYMCVYVHVCVSILRFELGKGVDRGGYQFVLSACLTSHAKTIGLLSEPFILCTESILLEGRHRFGVTTVLLKEPCLWFLQNPYFWKGGNDLLSKNNGFECSVHLSDGGSDLLLKHNGF